MIDPIADMLTPHGASDPREPVYLATIHKECVSPVYLWTVEDNTFVYNQRTAIWKDTDGEEWGLVVVDTHSVHNYSKTVAMKASSWDAVWEMIVVGRKESTTGASPVFWQFCSLNEDDVPLIGYESEDGDDYAEEEEGEE